MNDIFDRLIELDDEHIRATTHRNILRRLNKAYSENIRLQKVNGTTEQFTENSALIRRVRAELLDYLEGELCRVNSLLEQTQRQESP